MTLAEFANLVAQELPDNDTQQITAAKLRDVLIALAVVVSNGGFD
jgi:hypothetical protein